MTPVSGATPDGHGLSGVADAGAFLARLVRLDPAVLVRLRPAGVADRTALWARLPWGVLVTRSVTGLGRADVTVSAGQLLTELERGGADLPTRRDQQWRWPLPAPGGRLVETMPGAEVRRIAMAAAGALRTATVHGVAGRRVGERLLRDALLDHVAVVVTAPAGPADDGTAAGRPDDSPARQGEPVAAPVGSGPVEVPQRLVQAVHQMGFLGPERLIAGTTVRILVAGRWVGLAAPYGAAWLPKANPLLIGPHQGRPNG
ncbi:MAG TPA: hypothetical protein VGD43_24600 [Micromonospora sp.]